MSSENNRERESASDTNINRENEGVPTVNRRTGTNKVLTVIGYVFLIILGVGLIVLVNFPPKPKEKNNPLVEEVQNRMPPLVMPTTRKEVVEQLTPPPPPPLIVNTETTFSKNTNGKKELDWTDRKMSGEMLISVSNEEKKNGQPIKNIAPQGTQAASENNPDNKLATRLIPTVTAQSVASQLPDRNYLITKGTSLDCALETAIDSTVPGLTTCRLTRDTYSNNGQVLLLDRGSKLVGEYQGGIKQGQARIFVLWTRAETPNGVIVSLDSPGTDALGRSGLEGWVDNHFIERFGAAIMMSLLQGSIEALSNSTNNGSSVNFYDNTASGGEKIVEKILESTVNIPPTLIKNQGDHIQIMVARDLSFSNVYDLRVN